jgi:polysaccharide transporter, PST family
MIAMPLSLRRVALSSAMLMAESVLRLGLTAAVSFWIARSLGPEQFGLLNFASALMVIFLGVSALGLEIPLISRLAQGQPSGALLGAALVLRAGAALGALACCAALGFALHADNPRALAVTLIVALALLGYVPSVFDCWFKARVEAVAPSLVRLIGTVLSLTAKLLCLSWGGGVVALAWTVAFEALLYGALLSLVWWRSGARRAVHLKWPARAQAAQLLRDSWPYLVSGTATVVAMKVDVVLLGTLSSSVQTGVYSVVQKLSETLYIAPMALIESAYPALARNGTADAASVATQGQLLFDLAAACAFLASAAGLLLAGPLIGLVFGAAYADAVPLFQVHGWTCIAIALAAARYRWMAMLGLQRHAPAVTIAGALASVALNVMLIPRFGAWGAAWAALLSSFGAGLAASFLIRELRPLGMMQLKALWPWQRLLTRLQRRLRQRRVRSQLDSR